MALEREQEWFRQHRKELLEQHAGKWIVVHGETLVGVYDDFDTAFGEGIRKTGDERILVRSVTPDDEPFSAPANCMGILRAPVLSS